MQYQARLHRLRCFTSQCLLGAFLVCSTNLPSSRTIAAGNMSPSESTNDEEDEPETLEVRGKQAPQAFIGPSFEERFLFAGDSLGRLLEDRPQFWLERTGSSEMQTRLYVDGLGPERLSWELNGHAMGDLAVLGWQVSDIPVSWVGSLETYLGGSGHLGARVFRPLISVKTNALDESFDAGGRVGYGQPSEYVAEGNVAAPAFGRVIASGRQRLGGRTIYDDQGTWYSPEDDRIVQFDTERSGRQSILYDGQWLVGDSDVEIDALAFYLFDQRRGPASIQSQNIRVDAEREGAFAALGLSGGDASGWQAGVNTFFARRSVLRSDVANNPLTELNERFARLNSWGKFDFSKGQHAFSVEGQGTYFSRSENTSDFYGEFVARGAWSFDWGDGISNFCAVEWLVAERPNEGFLDAPMGDCGLGFRGDSYQGQVSLGYTLRRPTWVEWFGDGVDLLGNPDLNPEWGFGTAMDFTWYPSAAWTWVVDARVRAGEDWISWVPSSFSTRKAENLGQFRQAIAGLSVGWRPSSLVQIKSMARLSWTREREQAGTWKRLPQDVPLRVVTKIQWSPLASLSLDFTGDLLSERVLDRQNLVRSEPRLLLHAGAIVEAGAGFFLSLSARNLLNRMMAKGSTSTGESLDIAEMGLLGFPINGREIMLILALKGLEEL